MKIESISLAALAAGLQAFAAVGDFTRTVISEKLNGWDPRGPRLQVECAICPR